MDLTARWKTFGDDPLSERLNFYYDS
jgi:hypothetical protein